MPAPAPSSENTVPLLVLSPRYSEDSRILRRVALQSGWQVERLGSWDVPERLLQRRLIFSGEFGYIQVIAHKLSWALLDAPPNWLLHLSWNYRQRPIEKKTLADARKLTHPAFVKHATGKAFVAGVYASGADLPMESQNLSKATPVLIAEPVHWEMEFRFFVLERRVMTLSSYWRGDRSTRLNDGSWEAWPTEGEKAQDFLETLLADPDMQIPPAIVIDIGKIRGRGWAVIEANAVWALASMAAIPSRSCLSLPAPACVVLTSRLMMPAGNAIAMPGACEKWGSWRGDLKNQRGSSPREGDSFMMLQLVKRQAPVPPPAYHRAQAKL